MLEEMTVQQNGRISTEMSLTKNSTSEAIINDHTNDDLSYSSGDESGSTGTNDTSSAAEADPDNRQEGSCDT